MSLKSSLYELFPSQLKKKKKSFSEAELLQAQVYCRQETTQYNYCEQISTNESISASFYIQAIRQQHSAFKNNPLKQLTWQS